jgi:hypothetical protein
MTTYYVAASGGNNGNDGLTTGAPLATLLYAMTDKAVAGDTVILMDGAHESENGHNISQKPASTITIRAQNSGAASLTANTGLAGSTLYLSTQNVTFNGIVVEAGTHKYAAFINSANCADTQFVNCTFNSTTAAGAGFSVGSRNTKRLTFTGCTFTATGTANGFYGRGLTADHATDWTFTNCTFTTAATAVDIASYVDRVTFTGGELTTSAASSIAISIGTDYVTAVTLTDVTATGKAAAFKSVGKVGPIAISGGTYLADEAGSYCVNVAGAETSAVAISGATITGELRGVSVDGSAAATPVAGLTISDCVIAATNAADDANCRAVNLGAVSNVVISDCDCAAYGYGILASGRIAGFSASTSRFAGAEAIGAWIGGDSTNYMSGVVTITDCIAEGTGTLGKGFAFGGGMNGARISVNRLMSRNASAGIGLRIVNNLATESYPWVDTTCDIFDSFVDGSLVIGTGHDKVTIRSCTIKCQADSQALIVRRGITGAAINITNCVFINAPNSSGDALIQFLGTRNCTLTKCSLLSIGVSGRVIDADVNDTGQTVEGFALQACSIFVPIGGTLYNLPSAKLSATPTIRINGSAITKLDATSTFGTVHGTAAIATLAALQTAWDGNAGTVGNDGASALSGRKGQYGITKKVIRLL